MKKIEIKTPNYYICVENPDEETERKVLEILNSVGDYLIDVHDDN